MNAKRSRRGLGLGGSLFFLCWSVAAFGSDDFADLMNRPPWASCTYCHGETGAIDDPTVPALAGQSATYLRKQISDFRAGRRIDPSGMMSSALVLLDPEDDARVAAYFAEQKRTTPRLVRSQSPNEQTSQGERLFWDGHQDIPACATCHVSGALDAPIIDGLNPAYVIRQLERFRSGQRGNDANAVMRTVAASMDDAGINGVAEFIGSR